MRKDEYWTKNLNLASYLYASGLRLTGSNRVKGEVFFKFAPKDTAEKLEGKYFDGTAIINARDLFARLKDLRDIIFSEKPL